MEIEDVVRKLVGDTYPIGETSHDEKCLENLKVLTGVIDTLLQDVADIRKLAHRREFSIGECWRRADSFIEHVKKEYIKPE